MVSMHSWKQLPRRFRVLLRKRLVVTHPQACVMQVSLSCSLSLRLLRSLSLWYVLVKDATLCYIFFTAGVVGWDTCVLVQFKSPQTSISIEHDAYHRAGANTVIQYTFCQLRRNRKLYYNTDEQSGVAVEGMSDTCAGCMGASPPRRRVHA